MKKLISTIMTTALLTTHVPTLTVGQEAFAKATVVFLLSFVAGGGVVIPLINAMDDNYDPITLKEALPLSLWAATLMGAGTLGTEIRLDDTFKNKVATVAGLVSATALATVTLFPKPRNHDGLTVRQAALLGGGIGGGICGVAYLARIYEKYRGNR